MPVSRERIRRPRIVAHVVRFSEDVEVTFWYDRNKITDAWMGEWREHEEASNASALNEMLADLVERWDVYEDDAMTALVPLSAASIGELFSLPDKVQLMGELFTATIPSSAEGEASSGRSAPSPPAAPPASGEPSAARPPALQNGPATSPLPAPSASPFPS